MDKASRRSPPATGGHLVRAVAGQCGGGHQVSVRFRRSKNILVGSGTDVALKGCQPGAAVEEVRRTGTTIPEGQYGAKPGVPVPGNIRIVGRAPDGTLGYVEGDGGRQAQRYRRRRDLPHHPRRQRRDGRTNRRLHRTGTRHGAPARDRPGAAGRETPTDELSLVWFEREPRHRPTPTSLEALVKDKRCPAVPDRRRRW